jgi:hypothetical protein
VRSERSGCSSSVRSPLCQTESLSMSAEENPGLWWRSSARRKWPIRSRQREISIRHTDYRPPRSGRGGRTFKSCHSDQKSPNKSITSGATRDRFRAIICAQFWQSTHSDTGGRGFVGRGQTLRLRRGRQFSSWPLARRDRTLRERLSLSPDRSVQRSSGRYVNLAAPTAQRDRKLPLSLGKLC